MTPDSSASNTNEPLTSEAFASEVGSLLTHRHCEDVVVLNVTGLSQVCDYVVVATGTSDRQMKSVASEVSILGREQDFPAFRKSVDNDATWIVVDFISVVVHLFEPQRRAYYDLEDLWSDAKRIEVPTQSTT
ncbi:MAG: ribosome silencing factor [Phycisphaerae bacterium]|jgi:ribosome-associated protein|nr:ribosome silencing factor [Phycisphaerae bacterium]